MGGVGDGGLGITAAFRSPTALVSWITTRVASEFPEYTRSTFEVIKPKTIFVTQNNRANEKMFKLLIV